MSTAEPNAAHRAGSSSSSGARTTPVPAWSSFADHWALDRSLCFLNHGSFGATPRPVLEAQRQFRDRLEAEPVRFMAVDLEGLLDSARAETAALIGAAPDDIAFVHNATMGVNTVVRSLDLSPGDELLTSAHEYNACNNALEYVASRTGARVVRAEIPFPINSEDEAVGAVLRAVTPRTRLALLSHITSPTAVVLPVERLVRELEFRGVDSLVDTAHGPGMLPLHVERLGAAYCTGNFHKWVCAPKGSAFLHVRRDRQQKIRPLVISHGANSPRGDRSRFRLEMDFIGTLDPTPWLATPAAIRFMGSLLPGGWDEVRRRNRELALAARDLLCARLGARAGAPDAMTGSMAVALLPPRTDAEAAEPTRYFDGLQDRLLAKYGIQVPIVPFPAFPSRHVRISAQLYNTRAQYEYLADALAAELRLP